MPVSRWFRRRSRGVSSVEFAVFTPLLALIAIGAYDLGNALQVSMRLERAARAGAQYGAANPADVAGIRSAVIAAWPELTTADVPMPVYACFCATAAATCGSTCASGMVATVTVSAQKSVSPLLLPGIAARSGTAVLRAL